MRPLLDVESFGGIDADEDKLLAECFQDHEAYRNAVSHARCLVIGRKGSGKTAIFKKIVQAHDPTVFSLGHTFTDYPWHYHHLQASIGVPEEQRYYQSWQYVILLTGAKILLNQDQSQPWNDDARDRIESLEKFVIDSYGSRDPAVTQVFTPGKRLRIRPHLKIAQAEAGLDLERLPMSDLPRVFQELNQNMGDAIATCLNPKHNYYICFDELDRGFDPGDERYSQMLVGLILAARLINQRARAAGKSLSCVVFLRDDIYELLRFEDKNKITENLVSRIEWDSPRTKWTLKQLMERRFGAAIAGAITLAWDAVFDETQEMTSRQTKYQHILDRTFRRPRDIIKFCNEILNSYRAARGRASGKFENEDIINARTNYSDYLLRELDDEVHKHLPDYEDYLELVKSVGALQFKRSEFEAAVERRRDLLHGRDSSAVLSDLFRFSVIGYQRAGGVGGGSEYVWAHLDSRARFDEVATNFRVHPGFMEAFGLKKFRRAAGKA